MPDPRPSERQRCAGTRTLRHTVDERRTRCGSVELDVDEAVLDLELLVLWVLGLVTGTTIGGFIYVLLAVAVVLFVMQLMTGRTATVR